MTKYDPTFQPRYLGCYRQELKSDEHCCALAGCLLEAFGKFFRPWIIGVSIISVAACLIAGRRELHRWALFPWLILIGAPVLFVITAFSEGGLWLLVDARALGFRLHPDGADFLASHIAPGASYLLAREATTMSGRAVCILAQIEVAVFALLAATELLLVGWRAVG